MFEDLLASAIARPELLSYTAFNSDGSVPVIRLTTTSEHKDESLSEIVQIVFTRILKLIPFNPNKQYEVAFDVRDIEVTFLKDWRNLEYYRAKVYLGLQITEVDCANPAETRPAVNLR